MAKKVCTGVYVNSTAENHGDGRAHGGGRRPGGGRTPTKAHRAAAYVGATALVLGLAGCGGDGSGGAGSTTPAVTATESFAVPAGLTPPGRRLRLGQQAVVGWVPPSFDSGSGAKEGFKLQIIVESITKGAIADFKNVQLKAGERTSTPYYVKVRIKALGSKAPKSDTDPDVALDAIDDRGQKQADITFLGTFSRCDDKRPPQPFAKGRSYTSCLAYLMPGGGSIRQVQWNNGPSKADSVTPYFENPIVWEGS